MRSPRTVSYTHLEMHGEEASIQVYEETSGLGPGEPVESTGSPMSVELGPGLITSIYDGIQRPLDDIMKISGNNLQRGVEVASLKRDKKWEFVPVAKVGDEVSAGDVLGTVQELSLIHISIIGGKFFGRVGRGRRVGRKAKRIWRAGRSNRTDDG